jgi:hypothetical protein
MNYILSDSYSVFLVVDASLQLKHCLNFMVLSVHFLMPLMMVWIAIGIVLLRASSGKGASQALQSLSHEAGFAHINFSEFIQKGLRLFIFMSITY